MTMAIIKRSDGGMYSLRPMINDFFERDKFLFDKLWNNETVPLVNILENDKGYDIELAAPGMKKSDFKVKLENGMLNITAESKEEKEEKAKNYTRQEFRYNSFSRSFTLPENAKEDDVQARYEDGVLKLHIVKKAAAPSKVKEFPVT
jgi:HSP20 family protein